MAESLEPFWKGFFELTNEMRELKTALEEIRSGRGRAGRCRRGHEGHTRIVGAGYPSQTCARIVGDGNPGADDHRPVGEGCAAAPENGLPEE